MPQSPAASKREVVTAFRAVNAQARTIDQLIPIIEATARDSEVSKTILQDLMGRSFLGRLRWLVTGQ